MAQTTVRIRDSTHATLRKLARAEGRSMQAVLDEAIETLRRQRFLEAVNDAYASVLGDATETAELERERREWDATLLDGLEAREGGARYRSRRKSGARRSKA